MRTLACPDHGRLASDLALGRLGDAEAEAAEGALASCPICAAWWDQQFDGEAYPVVEREVGAAAARFVVPRHHVSRWWMAAAAVLVLALGGGVAWRIGPGAPQEVTPCCVAEVVEGAFQDDAGLAGDLNHDGQVDASDLALTLQARAGRVRPRT